MKDKSFRGLNTPGISNMSEFEKTHSVPSEVVDLKDGFWAVGYNNL